MKKFAFAGAAAAVLLAVPALAQPGGQRQAQPLTRAGLDTMVEAQFTRLDANGDGFVTRTEIEARAQARGDRQARKGERRGDRFARLDANRDGSVSRGEFDARAGARKGQRGEGRRGHRGGGMFARLGLQHFAEIDANRDSRLSLNEARAGALRLFERLDTDRDGTVSVEERRAARAAFGGQRRG
ncbi:MAG TPA: calcium-binding protein [Allosphingosinicella sp.]